MLRLLWRSIEGKALQSTHQNLTGERFPCRYFMLVTIWLDSVCLSIGVFSHHWKYREKLFYARVHRCQRIYCSFSCYLKWVTEVLQGELTLVTLSSCAGKNTPDQSHQHTLPAADLTYLNTDYYNRIVCYWGFFPLKEFLAVLMYFMFLAVQHITPNALGTPCQQLQIKIPIQIF